MSQPIKVLGEVEKKAGTFGAKFATLRQLKSEVTVSVDDKQVDEAADAVRDIPDVVDVEVRADTTGAKSSLDSVFSGAGLAVGAAAIGGLTAAFGFAVDAGQEFESGMASLSAVTGATGPLLDSLGASALSLSEKFGGSASDQLGVFQTTLSKIGPQLAQSPKDLETFANSVNLLSKTDSALGAAGAVDALTGSMLQFGINVNDSAEVARESSRFINVLAASAGVGSASVSQVSEAIAVAGATAKNSNISFEETNAALQVLASKSLVGSQAGTGLSTVLNKLTAQSKDGDDALKALGTSSGELAQLLNTEGIGASVGRLREAMEGLGTQAEKNALLNKLFGEGGQNAAAALLSGGKQLEEFTDGVTGTNAAVDQAAINMNTVAEKFGRVKAAIENTLIGAFQKIQPVISLVLDNLDTLVPVFIALAGAVGAYALASSASAIATGIASAATVVWNAILAANPLGLVAAAVVALTAGVIALADAMSVSAEEALGEAEAQKKVVESQIASNKERKKSVQSTRDLAAEFESLAGKTERTAKEEERLRYIQGELDKQYPDLIDQTKSFKDNLKGVGDVSKATTAEIDKLSQEGKRLQESLRDSEKLIAASRRNVALSELEDVAPGRLSRLGSTSGQEFITAFNKARQKFATSLYTAKTVDEVRRAQSALQEFVNTATKAGDLDLDDETVPALDAISKASESAITALKEYGLVAKDVPPPLTSGVEGGTDTAEKEGKKVVDVFKLAKEAVERLKKSQADAVVVQRELFDRQVALGQITKEGADLRIKQLEAKDARDLVAFAQAQLDAVTDATGFAIKTKIKGASEEDAKRLYNDLVVLLGKAQRALPGFDIKASVAKDFDPESVLEPLGDIIARAENQFGTIDIFPTLSTRGVNLQESLEEAFAGLDYSSLFEGLDDAAGEASAGVVDKFKAGTLSYQAAIVELAKTAVQDVDRFAQAFTLAADVIRSSVDGTIASALELEEKLKDPTLTAEEQAETQAQLTEKQQLAYDQLAVSAGATAAAMLVSGESVGAAFKKVAGDTAKSLLALYTPNVLALFASVIPPPFGLIAGGIAVAGLQALLATALNGFEKGGPTGDTIGKKQVAGVVHGKEFVAPEWMYTQNYDLLHHLYEGAPIETFPAIVKMLEENSIQTMKEAKSTFEKETSTALSNKESTASELIVQKMVETSRLEIMRELSQPINLSPTFVGASGIVNMGTNLVDFVDTRRAESVSDIGRSLQMQPMTVVQNAPIDLSPLQVEMQNVTRQLESMEALHEESVGINITADAGYHARQQRRQAIRSAR